MHDALAVKALPADLEAGRPLPDGVPITPRSARNFEDPLEIRVVVTLDLVLV